MHLTATDVPLGTSIARKALARYTPESRLIAPTHEGREPAITCFFCGNPELYEKDYCLDCFNAFVRVKPLNANKESYIK